MRWVPAAASPTHFETTGAERTDSLAAALHSVDMVHNTSKMESQDLPKDVPRDVPTDVPKHVAEDVSKTCPKHMPNF